MIHFLFVEIQKNQQSIQKRQLIPKQKLKLIIIDKLLFLFETNDFKLLQCTCIFFIKKILNLEQIEIRVLIYMANEWRRSTSNESFGTSRAFTFTVPVQLYNTIVSMRKVREVAIVTSITTCHVWGLCHYGNGLFCIQKNRKK